MPSSFPVGIDLGATSSAIARVDDLGRSMMVRNPLGDLLIPSIVFFEDDELVFGSAAKQAASTDPTRAAECVKRDLGQASYARAIGGELLPAEVIEACLLKKMTADLGPQEGARPAVVLAIPASFNQAQRRALLEAAQIAGLDLLGTIDEPLAAALAFAENQGYLNRAQGDKVGCRVLVFDLGGGKLDVSIVELKPRQLRTLAVGGETRLGGRDWDVKLADYLAGEYAKQFGQDPRHDMVSVRRILQMAEETKHTLTVRAQARVRVERSANAADIAVTRQAFEELTADLVDRARGVTEQVLTRAGLAWRDLAHLLLVGGATRMPMIGKMLEQLTGMKAALNVHPDEAVARGAALIAEQRLAEREHREPKVRVEVTDLTSHSLGIEWINADTGFAENVVLIQRGSELPCATTSKAVTQREDQTAIIVQLLEGEGRAADQCTRIAELVIRDLPLGLPKNWQAEVQYQFTSEGLLQAKAVIPKTGQPLHFELRRDGGLTEKQVLAWKELLARQEGLKPILAELSRQQSEAGKPPPLAKVAWDTPPPAPEYEPVEPDYGEPTGVPPDSQPFEIGEGRLPRSSRKRQNPSRSVLFNVINVSGFVLFSALGLAIGYYILMWLRPEWNIYHLALPGLR